MIEKINTIGYETISKYSVEAIEALRIVKALKGAVVAGEIGVGIGATTIEMLRLLDARDCLHIFDYENMLTELVLDIKNAHLDNYVKIIKHGNTRKIFDSYAWALTSIAQELLNNKSSLMFFDFVYLDGAHSFHCDAAATAVLKEMIAIDGFIVFDDMKWTFDKSPSLNANVNPAILEYYTPEQLSVPHIERIVKVLMEGDDRYKRVYFNQNYQQLRAIYKRVK